MISTEDRYLNHSGCPRGISRENFEWGFERQNSQLNKWKRVFHVERTTACVKKQKSKRAWWVKDLPVLMYNQSPVGKGKRNWKVIRPEREAMNRASKTCCAKQRILYFTLKSIITFTFYCQKCGRQIRRVKIGPSSPLQQSPDWLSWTQQPAICRSYLRATIDVESKAHSTSMHIYKER